MGSPVRDSGGVSRSIAGKKGNTNLLRGLVCLTNQGSFTAPGWEEPNLVIIFSLQESGRTFQAGGVTLGTLALWTWNAGLRVGVE